MLLQLCNKVGVITWFKINQKHIAEMFCVNKSKPQMACNGKCYLKNKLNKAEKAENTTSGKSNSNIKLINEELFINEIDVVKFFLPLKILLFSNTQNLYTYKCLSRLFHPPQC